MSDAQAIAQLLGKTELFGSLPESERELLAQRMRPVSFSARQHIFARGDEGKELYLVKSGRVRLSVLSSEGRELSLAHATDGGVFGEIAVLDGARRTADATAISAVAALSLSRAALIDQMQKHPAVAQVALRYLCKLLRETDLKIEAIALHPIEVRLARFLLSAALLQNTSAKGKAWPLKLGMSQSELGLLIGATRPKVNAALVALEDTGVIRRDSSDTILCDIDFLKTYAATDDEG